LVGAAGALAARQAGALADKGKAKLTTSAGLLIMLASWAAIALGAHYLTALIIGILLLDLAVQAVHITNQSVIYAQKPEARNRLNAGYMTSYFIGGAFGSLLSANAYHLAGWYGVCAAGALMTLVNLLIWWRGHRFENV
jgi:predicted MFS family arabinose efflux permease